MTRTPNDRDRLALAFAELNRHGILARPAIATTAEQGHALLRAELAARNPHGLGSYVFFTLADAQRFDATGDLTALPLHCSNEGVARAVEAVCPGARVDPRPIDRTAVPQIATDTRRAAVTRRPAGAAPSPWRWLGPRTAVTGS
jgi:hypothetical protein